MVTNFLMFQFLIAVQNIMIVIYLVLNSLDGLIEGKGVTVLLVLYSVIVNTSI